MNSIMAILLLLHEESAIVADCRTSVTCESISSSAAVAAVAQDKLATFVSRCGLESVLVEQSSIISTEDISEE